MEETIRSRSLVVAALSLVLAGCDRSGPSNLALNASASGPASASPPAGTRAPADASDGADGRDKETSDVKIRLITEDAVLTATLVDNAATRDFVSLLPLKLTLRDYADTEKVSDLPSRLSTRGTPEGIDPDIGDITYYAPWGNLAIFYRDFGYSSGLVKLGRIDSGLEKLAMRRGNFAVRFEVADKGAQ